MSYYYLERKIAKLESIFKELTGTRSRVFENNSIDPFMCETLRNMIESNLDEINGYVDIADDNADNGYINVGVEDEDGNQAEYDVIMEDDNKIQILFEDSEIARCDSLKACAKLIALHFRRMV